jgi:osmoprotectant transport system ATP-binding protein
MSTQGVEFQSLNVTVPASSGQASRPLLHDITLRIAPNTTTALLGRSGSGKTTLLRTVNALVRPTSGRVLIGDHDVAKTNPIRLRRSIGYVIQETGLFPRMTIARNIGMALEVAGNPDEEIKERTAEMLKLVGLPEGVLRRYPWQLSGGQRQRVGLARALVNEPSVLLMDEPFGALDPLTRAEMQTMLRYLLLRAKKTTLIVTHDLEEALYLADRVVFLDSGEIVADLPSNEVRTSQIPAVQAYVAATHRAPDPTPTHTPDPAPTHTFDPAPTHTFDPTPTHTFDPTPTHTIVPTPTLPSVSTSVPDPELPKPPDKPKQNWWEI